MNNPFVSIIVPNYNHAAFLEQRLESVFNQTFKDFEVILLDDASTDHSVEILKKYASHLKVSHFEVNKKNSGSPFKQWQKGINLAKGEYIWIAESDDFCELDFLESIFIMKKESDEDLELIYSQSFDVNEHGKIISNRIGWTEEFKPNPWRGNFSSTGPNFIKNYLKVKNVIPNASAVVYKKSLLKGSFPYEILDMNMCGDWFFWIKICSGTSVGFIAEPLNYFRGHKAVSRIHFNRNSKRKRLKEEAAIRNFLQTNGYKNQQREIRELYKKWFAVHPIAAISEKQFYDIIIDKTSYLSFLIQFYQHKIHVK